MARKTAEKDIVIPAGTESVEWHEACEVDPSNKAELQWMYTQMQRCGIRSISDIENMIARA